MRSYRFCSELTCDEVWHRLNILLRSFAVWGPKRYEVSGELTAWGCYLWLTRAGKRGGIRLPLWLWTEDGGETGCKVCCRTLPHRNRFRWVLYSAVCLGFDALFSEVSGGASPVRAAKAGVCAGCTGAFVLFLIFWAVPWFFSVRRNAQLLDWIQAYLLRRELEGILLPKPESQREAWAGLPERPEIKRSAYTFHCATPPEETAAAVEQWMKHSKDGARISVSRRGMRLILSGTVYEEGASGADALRIFSGWYRSWQYSDPFCGRLEPDGSGGCVLRGVFVPNPFSLGLRVLFLLGLGCLLFQTVRSPVILVILLPAAGWDLYAGYRNSCGNDASLAVLELLRTYFEEV